MITVHSVLEQVTRDDLVLEPYPHIVKEDCLPASYYAELLRSYPSDEMITDLYKRHAICPPALRGEGLRQNTRYDVSASQVMETCEQFPEIWTEFVRYHSSPEFFAQVVRVIGPEIVRTYPFLEERLGKRVSDLTTGIRFRSKADVSLDCQIGINTPPTTMSAVRGPHADAPVELFAILLYLKDQADERTGGDLAIYRWRDPNVRRFVGAEVEEADVELVKTVTYRPNTMVMFLNSDDALHGVLPRAVSSQTRRLVNIIGEVDQSIPSGLFVMPQKYGEGRSRKNWLTRKINKIRKVFHGNMRPA